MSSKKIYWCYRQQNVLWLRVALSLPASSFTDGLLGMDFLREVDAIIDVANAEIRLEN